MATPKTPAQKLGLYDNAQAQLAEEIRLRSVAENELVKVKKLLEETIYENKETVDDKWRAHTHAMEKVLGEKREVEKLNSQYVAQLNSLNEEKEALQKYIDQAKAWAVPYKEEHEKLVKGVEEEKKKFEQVIRDGNAQVDKLTVENVDKTKKLTAITAERDALAKAAASLKEQLAAIKATEPQQPFFQAATTAQPPPQLNNKPQAVVDKSNSILNSLRASASVTPAQQTFSQQRIEVTYTQAELDCRVMAAKQEQFEFDQREAQQHVQNLNAEHNKSLENFFEQAKQELDIWKNSNNNNGNAQSIEQIQIQRDQYKKELEAAEQATWHANVATSEAVKEKRRLASILEEQKKTTEDYRSKLNAAIWERTQEKQRADQNYNECKAERERRINARRNEEKITYDFREENRALREQIEVLKEKAKGDKVKKGPDTGSVPKRAAARRQAQAQRQAVEEEEEVEHGQHIDVRTLGIDPSRFLPHLRLQPGVQTTTKTASKAATSSQSTNKRKRRVDDEEAQVTREVPWDNPPAATFIKTAALLSFNGLVHVAKKRGWF